MTCASSAEELNDPEVKAFMDKLQTKLGPLMGMMGGGMGGMPGGMGDFGDDDEVGDDNDMPDLEEVGGDAMPSVEEVD